jgi:sortase A
MQTITVKEESYIGVIQIPSLNLELPVNSEWSYPKLKHSPCRYAGSYLDDTLVMQDTVCARIFGDCVRFKFARASCSPMQSGM